MDYFDYESVVSKSNPISYTYIGKKINKGGRGDTYEMMFQYFNKKGTVNITSIEYELIEDSNYPKLYISGSNGIIFSMWEFKRAYRIAILFLVLFIVTIFPWRKIKPIT